MSEDIDPDAEREKLAKRVERYRARMEQTRKERGRLKWCLVVGTVLAPVGLFWGWLYMLWIFFGGVIFWGVGMYLNWGHVKDGNRALETAQKDLDRFDQSSR